MKRLWLILFVIPLFAQEVEKSLTIKKGANLLTIKSGDRVYVRYYKKDLSGNRSLNKLPGSKSLFYSKAKASTYLTIDYTLKVIKTDYEEIPLSDLYSISPVSDGTMALKYAKNNFKRCGILGFPIPFIFIMSIGGGEGLESSGQH